MKSKFKPRRDKNGDNQIAVFTSGVCLWNRNRKGKHDYTVPAARNSRGAPEFIGGLIKWKDSTIPVVDLRFMFGEGETRVTKKTKILIVDTGGQLAGFIVDDINIIRKYPEDEIERLRQFLRNMKPDT